ncbi:thiamine phosphate synthase [Parasphingopyxis algicola]|nr:thiamine phosphate synthase [Parasphingopyxis algicola]
MCSCTASSRSAGISPVVIALAIGSRVRRRHPLPTLWLMTDERQGDRLWPALRALPRGSGVIVRHYSLGKAARRALIARIRRIARRRRLVMVVAGPEKLALATRADGYHARSSHIGSPMLLRTAAVHNLAELRLAERVGADLAFLSPVYATTSHPGGRAMGRRRFGLIARQSRVPIVALGGIDEERAQSLEPFGIYGWAAVGALTPSGS